jgi:type III secretory pathway component EscT
MVDLKKVGHEILRITDSAVENSLSVDVLLLYRIYQRITILPALRQDCGKQITRHCSAVLCESLLQRENCYFIGQKSI